MRYRVRGLASDGTTFYLDGSEVSGTTFTDIGAAWDYALVYARVVAGRDGTVDDHRGGIDVAYIRAEAADGYAEEIRLEVSA